ncbi:MAG: aminoglycoside phosphotransferase family protein [Planctomycetota bacterium]
MDGGINDESGLALSIGQYHVPQLGKAYVDRLGGESGSGGGFPAGTLSPESADRPSSRDGVRTYLLNAGPELRYLVKLYAAARASEITAEVTAAKLLDSAGVRVPSPVLEDTSCRIFPVVYRVARFLEGFDLREGRATGRVDDEGMAALGGELGGLMARVHSLSPQGVAEGILGKRGDSLGEQAGQMLRVLADQSLLEKGLLEHLRREVYQGLERLHAQRDLRLVHGSLSLDHVIVEESGLNYFVSGLTGLRHAHLADPIWDIAHLELTVFVEEPLLRGSFLRAYLDNAPALPSDVGSRMRLYVLLHLMGQLTMRQVPGGERAHIAAQLTELLWRGSKSHGFSGFISPDAP